MDYTEEMKAKIRDLQLAENQRREREEQQRVAELAKGNRAQRRHIAAMERKRKP